MIRIVWKGKTRQEMLQRIENMNIWELKGESEIVHEDITHIKKRETERGLVKRMKSIWGSKKGLV